MYVHQLGEASSLCTLFVSFLFISQHVCSATTPCSFVFNSTYFIGVIKVLLGNTCWYMDPNWGLLHFVRTLTVTVAQSIQSVQNCVNTWLHQMN